uniref:Carboxylesterase type B domain-containing protein n=1 Tax=Ditylenchus dipsaci TaxID=166011 RepID=A0A915E3G8_9BILA
MKLLSTALFLLLIVLVRCENSTENSEIDAKLARVETKYGSVQGFVHEIGHEGGVTLNADIFLGIPYAKPPIGELRFEKPEDPDAYSNGSLSALTFGPACASFAPMVGEPMFSEDCLHLNVFTLPRNPLTKCPCLFGFTGVVLLLDLPDCTVTGLCC